MALRCDLVYGQSGSGKTTWCLRLAEHMWTTKGMKTRWYLGDGGYGTLAASGLIEEGAIEVMEYALWTHPWETTQFICEGRWPKDPSDPSSKLEKVDLKKLAETHGMLVYEGLTFMSDYLMGDMEGGLADRMSKGESLNNDESFRFTDGSVKVGGNARTHFMRTQSRMEHNVKISKGFPGWVQWTSHERQSKDDDTKQFIFGPDVSGNKLTGKIGASFDNTIHLHPVTTKVQVRDPITNQNIDTQQVTYRAYTRKHYDPEKTSFAPYFANTRMPYTQTALMPEFLAPPDPLKYYGILADAQRAHREQVAAQKATTTI